MNEFVARNGLIALDSSSISGPFVVTGSIYASSGISTLGSIAVNSFGGSIQTGNLFSFYSSAANITSLGSLTITHAAPNSIFIQKAANITSATGDFSFLYINSDSRAFVPTTGSSTLSVLRLTPVVSQSGEANGITRGLYISPNIINAADFRAIQWDNNAVTAPSASWGLYGSGSAPNYINGNLLVGTTSNTGEKLQVGGTMKVTGYATFGSAGFALVFDGNGVRTDRAPFGIVRDGVNYNFYVSPIFGQNTSGTHNIISTPTNYQPTSGTAVFNTFVVNTTVSQSGGANGITRGVYVNPTITAAADWRSIEWSNNSATAPSASWGLYGAGTAPNYLNGSLGIGTTSPTFRLDINGSFRSSGSITATSGSDYFDISHDLTQPAQTGSQIYEVNITPTLRYTAPNQTQTALRVAATFTGSTALSSSQSNIIADFGSTSAGSQFLVNDVTSGSIYMVNDVSGLPIIEANSNWDVMIYDYPNVVLRKTGSAIIISGSLTIASGSNNDLYMYGHKMFSVGAFQSDQTQSGSANVSQSITYNATDYSQGVSVVSGSRLTVANAGVYNIQFSVQVDRTTGTGVDTIHIWLKKNGTNVTNSSGTITISGNASQAKTVSSWNYVVDSVANDYYELCWQTSDTAIQLINVVATGNIPGTPSVIVTVTQVR
jgi:hypothetical protein